MFCRSKEWTGDYSTDYQDLLPGNNNNVGVDDTIVGAPINYPVGTKAYQSFRGPLPHISGGGR